MYEIHDRIGASMTARTVPPLTAALDIMLDCSLSDGVRAVILGFRAEQAQYALYRGRLISSGCPLIWKSCGTDGVYDCKSFYGYLNTVLYGQDGALYF